MGVRAVSGEKTAFAYSDDISLDALTKAVSDIFGFDAEEQATLDFGAMAPEQITEAIWQLALQKYEAKEASLDDPAILPEIAEALGGLGYARKEK